MTRPAVVRMPLPCAPTLNVNLNLNVNLTRQPQVEL